MLEDVGGNPDSGAVSDAGPRATPNPQPPNPKPLLTVRGLHTWFELRRWGFARAGVVQAVDGVSFALGSGEAIAVVGESGCGKSTLARSILGLVPPTRGEIVFSGQPLFRGARDRGSGHRGTGSPAPAPDPQPLAPARWYRAQVGFIQQDPYGALPPFMNVRRILGEPLAIHRVGDQNERQARIRGVLEEVKLTPVEDFLRQFPHMLSGGQQQRVVIARAIILRPKLLVADEPVSMLDASVRVEILELLRSLQQAHNLSLVYITHDLSTVRHFAERVLVMYAGKLVEQASVQELLQSPLHPYTQALLRAIPDADPENAQALRETLPGEPPSLLKPPSGCRFHPRCPFAIKELCEREEPPEVEAEKGHLVACWLYQDRRVSSFELRVTSAQNPPPDP